MTSIGENLSLGEAASNFVASLAPEKRAANQQGVSQFARWFGRERPFSGLTPAEVESFAEQLSLSDTDYLNKLELVRAFLTYAKKKGWSQTNLSVHLKVRKGKTKAQTTLKKDMPEGIPLTRQGYDNLKAELAELKEESHKLIAEIRRAAADKDFRENAPLHAARERRGHVEGRIMELEATIKAAVIVDEKRNDGQKVGIGDRVVLCETGSDDEVCYTLVPPKEADVIRSKISSASPMGQAILGKEPGATVEITAPVGRLSYRIKRIER